MPHREYVRIVPGAETAVLFLHGIVGTPRHFDSRLPLVHLVPKNVSVYSLLLPGHGGTVEDFSRSTMHQWKEYVWKTFDALAQTHCQVILAGHSMGTLFALQLAREFPEKIPLLFLIAAPICPQLSLAAVAHSFGLIFPHSHGDPKITAAMGSCGSVTLTKKLWKYLPWIPNFWNLLGQARRTKKSLPYISTKTLIFQSRRDELVARRSVKHLQKISKLQLHELQQSTHFYYSEEDTCLVQQAFVNALREVTG